MLWKWIRRMTCWHWIRAIGNKNGGIHAEENNITIDEKNYGIQSNPKRRKIYER